jgi:hypothetical protein
MLNCVFHGALQMSSQLHMMQLISKKYFG